MALACEYNVTIKHLSKSVSQRHSCVQWSSTGRKRAAVLKPSPCNQSPLLNVMAQMSRQVLLPCLLFSFSSTSPSSPIIVFKATKPRNACTAFWLEKMPHHQSSCNVNLCGWRGTGRVSHYRDKYRNENSSKHCLTWGRRFNKNGRRDVRSLRDVGKGRVLSVNSGNAGKCGRVGCCLFLVFSMLGDCLVVGLLCVWLPFLWQYGQYDWGQEMMERRRGLTC